MNPVKNALARELAVKEPSSIRSWIYSLFFVASRPGVLRNPRLRVLYRMQGFRHVAEHIGVEDPTDYRSWLFFLFVMPGLEQHYLSWHFQKMVFYSKSIFFQFQNMFNTRFMPVVVELDKSVVAGKSLASSLLLILLTPILVVVITTPLNVNQQFIFASITFIFVLFYRNAPTLVSNISLVALAIIATFRYASWRLLKTLDVESFGEHVLAYLLIMAEIYTWLVALLSYVQSIMPLRRPPLSMPTQVERWPSVDIFIPTYNEPLEVIKPTIFAAQGIDWPSDKLNIYILDDGHRDQFREFARQAGVRYIVRDNNLHAKAGNLNHALMKTHGDYIAIFDCDHIPTRTFLQLTMGWMIDHPKRALLQTPHHFFSADPFERNLKSFRQVPNEGYLFNRLLQDGNDLWNASFFCGSCAILKREPLVEIGGVAVETVTEDAHTALKLHRQGYESLYLNIPLAAGLATESLSGHVGQRIRWARGMIQIFRTDNPWFGKGLSLYQRLCYGSASLHFFFGIPRLIFLTAPLGYLFFEYHFIHAEVWLLFLYVMPYITFTNMANSKLLGRYRHSFWAEVYETVLAIYIMVPTTLAMINPKLGTFNVTPKGGLIEKSYVDLKISFPYTILSALNFLGIGFGVVRLFWWNSYEYGVVLMNILWTIYNVIITGAAFAVSKEARQLRKAHRVPAKFAAVLYLPDGRTWATETLDFSATGLSLKYPQGAKIDKDLLVSVGLYRGDQEFCFPAHVIFVSDGRLNLSLAFPSLSNEANYIRCTFSRADAWADWLNVLIVDKPLSSLKEVLVQSMKGYRILAHFLYQSVSDVIRHKTSSFRA